MVYVLTANKSNIVCLCETNSCNVWDLYPKKKERKTPSHVSRCLVKQSLSNLVCTKVWSYFEWAKYKLMRFVFCNSAI